MSDEPSDWIYGKLNEVVSDIWSGLVGAHAATATAPIPVLARGLNEIDVE